MNLHDQIIGSQESSVFLLIICVEETGSGQLSGIVISFMLAMNKVYPSKLSTLLIDDPVQTMDEVNMASFVQMMKYEFPEKQVLLSTHENKVANYFNYKYNEAGLKTLPINMKNKRLEITFP